MGSHRKVLRGVVRLAGALSLSLVLTFATIHAAFGDFVPDPNTQILGVGRIQSTLPETTVAPAAKFALASAETRTEQTVELVAPIAREIAPVTYYEPAYVEDYGYVTEGGWIYSMATNYATPEDGFLDCMTASGTYTTLTSMGVAHKYLPLGTVIEIYCPRTGLSCIATVDDRGPYAGYWGLQADSFDFQMGVTAALGDVYGWYQVMYRIL